MYHIQQQEEEKETPHRPLALPQAQKNDRNVTTDKDYLRAVDSLPTKRDYNERKQTSPVSPQDEENMRKAHVPRWVSKK